MRSLWGLCRAKTKQSYEEDTFKWSLDLRASALFPMPSNNTRTRLELCRLGDEIRKAYFLKRKFYVPLKLGHDFKRVLFLSFQVSLHTVKRNEAIRHIVLWGIRL